SLPWRVAAGMVIYGAARLAGAMALDRVVSQFRVYHYDHLVSVLPEAEGGASCVHGVVGAHGGVFVIECLVLYRRFAECISLSDLTDAPALFLCGGCVG